MTNDELQAELKRTQTATIKALCDMSERMITAHFGLHERLLTLEHEVKRMKALQPKPKTDGLI